MDQSAHSTSCKVRKPGAIRVGITLFRVSGGSTIRATLVVLCLVLLPACGSVEPYAISKAILLAVLIALKTKKKLQFDESENRAPGDPEKTPDQMTEDRHKAHFIFRRTEMIGARHTGFGATELAPLVEAQFDQVVAFLETKLGPTGSLRGYFEPGGASSATKDQAFTCSPQHHFDLSNIAIVLKGETTTSNREAFFRQQRWLATRAIVWRATALHDELWSGGGDGAVLNAAALNEVLDRRLRSIERMLFQVNSGGSARTGAPNTGRGPWFDRSRVRVFEYPYFSKSLIQTSDINVIWKDFSPTTVQYKGFLIGNLGTRFDSEPGSVSTTWVPQGTYRRNPGSGSIATALDNLFQSQLNIWARAWLFCDHSIAAIHLEALRFALERRGQGGTFDGLVRPKGPFLSAIFGTVTYDPDGTPHAVDTDELWSDGVRAANPGDTGVFDDLFVQYRDLQVGDHVILWNHHLYLFVTTGAWRLENAFITNVDPAVDKWDGTIDPAVFMRPKEGSLQLDGFGGGSRVLGRGVLYGTFLRTLLEDSVKPAFDRIVQTASTASGNVFVAPRSNAAAAVVRWAPYPTGLDKDPWFIFLERSQPYPDVSKMLEIIRHSVADGPKSERGSDYVSPPTSVTVPGESTPRNLQDGVFFPLFLPVVDGKEMEWSAYFKKRKGGSVNAELTPVRLTTSDVPGLFARGANAPTQAIRPRVRP